MLRKGVTELVEFLVVHLHVLAVRVLVVRGERAEYALEHLPRVLPPNVRLQAVLLYRPVCLINISVVFVTVILTASC